jgi:hypothetical protein
MAIVKSLRRITLERESKHLDVECTYSILRDARGYPMMQIDTYGSVDRAIPGKKSQSIRFTRSALSQLRAILDSELE